MKLNTLNLKNKPQLSVEQKAQMQGWVIHLSHLAQRHDVRFHFGAERAETDGRNIYLPMLPIDMNSEEEIIFRGYAEHEIGHCIESNMPVFQGVARSSSWLGTMLNAIEDPWMENRRVKARPKALTFFEKSTAYLEKRGGLKTGSSSPNEALMVFVLSALHLNFGRNDLRGLHKQSQKHFLKQLGRTSKPILKVIKHFVEKQGATSTSTSNNATIARGIYQILRDLIIVLGKRGQVFDEDLESKCAELYGVSQVDETPNGVVVASASCPVDVTKFVNSIKRRSAGKLSYALLDLLFEPPSEGEVIDYCKVIDDISEQAEKDGRELVPAGTEITPYEIAEVKASHIPSGLTMDISGLTVAKDSLSDFHEAMNSVKSTVNILAMQLRQVLQEKTRERRRIFESGTKVKAGKLYRLTSYDYRVFRENVRRTTPNAAVTLLCDLSASTVGDCDLEIRQSAVLLAASLDYLKLPSSVWGFGNNCGNSLMLVKDFNEQFRSTMARFGGMKLGLGGSTPLAESINALLPCVRRRLEQKKVVFVITDGIPNDVDQAVESYNLARSQGISVVTVVFGQWYEWLDNASLPFLHCEKAEDIPKIILSEMSKLI